MSSDETKSAAISETDAVSAVEAQNDEIDEACRIVIDKEAQRDAEAGSASAPDQNLDPEKPAWAQKWHLEVIDGGRKSENASEDDRPQMVPVGEDGKPDFASAPEDLRPDYGEFAEAAAHWVDGPKARFRATLDRVEYLAEVMSDQSKQATVVGFKWRWLCGCLIPLANTRTAADQVFGAYVMLKNKSGDVVRFIMLRECVSDLRGLKAVLSGRGLNFKPGNSTLLQKILEYIHDRPLKESWRSTERVGWHIPGESFVLPEKTLRRDGAETVVFEPGGSKAAPLAIAGRGDLEGWKQNVASLAKGNRRPVFALSVAFAAALLEPLRSEGGGFHIWGASSTGKTTMLELGGSVWGGASDQYIQSWRTTDNALEVVCQHHNSALLCLDEVAQVERSKVGEIAYLIANGSPKNRQRREGGLRSTISWCLLFLSSGEDSLASVTAGKAKAGQEVRFVDLKADAGYGHGVWDDAPEAGAATLSDRVKAAVELNYGVAGPAFVQAVLDGGPELVERLKRELAQTIGNYDLPDGCSGQVRRVACRFAICDVAGELAIELGILPFPVGECHAACKRLFEEWRQARGTDGDAEELKVIRAVRDGLLASERSRFEIIGKEADGIEDRHRIHDRLGYVEYTDESVPTFFVTAPGWKELIQDFDDKWARDVLLRADFLRAGKTGNTRQKKVRGQNVSVTEISGTILGYDG